MTYILAEAGVNHNGSLELALKLVDIAAKSGANAIKFQTFNSNKLSTSINVDSLKSETVFSPITERTHINQKYIEELDSY